MHTTQVQVLRGKELHREFTRGAKGRAFPRSPLLERAATTCAPVDDLRGGREKSDTDRRAFALSPAPEGHGRTMPRLSGRELKLQRKIHWVEMVMDPPCTQVPSRSRSSPSSLQPAGHLDRQSLTQTLLIGPPPLSPTWSPRLVRSPRSHGHGSKTLCLVVVNLNSGLPHGPPAFSLHLQTQPSPLPHTAFS